MSPMQTPVLAAPRDGREAPRRPVRAVATLAAGCAALAAVSWMTPSSSFAGVAGDQLAFCGSSGCGPIGAKPIDMASGVAMEVKSRMWSFGVPNKQMIEMRKRTNPSLNNMKDQFFILWARSPKVKHWYPINIISGSDAAKNLKGVKDNAVAKAVGVDKLADYQIVKAIGMNIYGQIDEVKKQAVKMHPNLAFASELEFGYKEIMNNTKFNKNPGLDMQLTNISRVPPEEELRNILDDAGDAVANAGETVTKTTDNIKGFLSGFSGTGSGR